MSDSKEGRTIKEGQTARNFGHKGRSNSKVSQTTKKFRMLESSDRKKGQTSRKVRQQGIVRQQRRSDSKVSQTTR